MDTWMDEHHAAFQQNFEEEIQMEEVQRTDENEYTEGISQPLASPATPSASPMTPWIDFDSALKNSTR